MTNSWSPQARARAVERLRAEFRENPPVRIERSQIDGERVFLRFTLSGVSATNGRASTTSGRLLNPDEDHWDPLGVWDKKFFVIGEAPNSTKLRRRMADLRRCGLDPELAAKLVMEHYWKRG